jgi:hypothetical protein
MMALALELYYATTRQERAALCEQSLAMARRLGDQQLLLDILLAMPLGIWSPATADLRYELTDEAVALAREIGDGVGLATALALRATATSESGRIAELFTALAEAREQAEKERQLFAQLFLDGLEIPWRAMRDEFDAVHTLTAHMVTMHERTGVPQTGDALVGAFLMDLMWSEQNDTLVTIADQVGGVQVMPVDGPLAAILGRAGRLEEARERLSRPDLELSADWWFSLLSLPLTAEAAMRTGMTDLAALAYERLVPFAGLPAAGGSGTVAGVVDFYLAMAAHATGERDLAVRHADEAIRVCTEWEIPLAAAWFTRVRDQFGF